jgi:CRISPR system Cascade subunit CasC
MRIELHILQNFPPANLNRDDTGSPKDCEFGGYRRARISSQCLKRSIRTSPVFEHNLQNHLAKRTKKSAEPLAERLTKQHGHDVQVSKDVAEAVVGHMLGWDEKKENTKVLFFVGNDELDELAALVHGQWDALSKAITDLQAIDKEKEKKASEAAEKAMKAALDALRTAFTKARKDHVKAVDIALFGRMLAEVPEMNIDAACQVAHALSTNKVDMDFDYFTAVDDLNKDEETGAGMIGTVGFNSSCFYRYVLLDTDQLAKNLGGDRTLALDGIKAFLEASIVAIPTGKQNSFAAQTPPSLVMAVVRPAHTMPWSLANAFETPVRPYGDKGLVEMSVKMLGEHWGALKTMYGLPDGTQVFVSSQLPVGDSLQEYRKDNVQQVIVGVAEALASWAGGAA